MTKDEYCGLDLHPASMYSVYEIVKKETYAEFDDDGLCGISPNAPDEVKKAYEDYLAEEEEAKSKGIKI
jgi:hypothetical protein